jgi:hypothetical protein
MDASRYEIDVAGPDGSIECVVITHTHHDDHMRVDADLRLLGAIQVDVADGDFFGLLIKVRRAIEPVGYRLLCNAACTGSYPSPMAREGGGWKVYQLEMGRPALRAHLVESSGPAPREAVGTIEEQAAFYERWLDSLGRS